MLLKRGFCILTILFLCFCLSNCSTRKERHGYGDKISDISHVKPGWHKARVEEEFGIPSLCEVFKPHERLYLIKKDDAAQAREEGSAGELEQKKGQGEESKTVKLKGRNIKKIGQEMSRQSISEQRIAERCYFINYYLSRHFFKGYKFEKYDLYEIDIDDNDRVIRVAQRSSDKLPRKLRYSSKSIPIEKEKASIFSHFLRGIRSY